MVGIKINKNTPKNIKGKINLRNLFLEIIWLWRQPSTYFKLNIELNIHNIQVFHHLLIILIAVLSGPNQDLTYSSKRKMSQRQKKTRVHQGTQTEEIYFSDYGHMNGEGEYYDEHSTLYTRLLKAEEVRLSYRL